MCLVAGAEAWLSGRGAAGFKVGDEPLPARLAHQPLVHISRRLLAAAHGVGDIRRAGDYIAAGIEVRPAGLVSEAIHDDRPLLLERKPRGAAEVLVEALAHGQNHAVGFKALHLAGGDRLAAAA